MDTLVRVTRELAETHATDRQKEQIRDLYLCSVQTTAEICKAALAAAVAAYHEEADTDHVYLCREAYEAGMWADGNLPT